MKNSSTFDWYNVPEHTNESLDLGSKAVELHWKGRSLKGTTQVRATFLPRPRLLLDIEAEVNTGIEWFNSLFDQSVGGPVIRLLDRGDSTEVLAVKGQFGEGVTVTVTPRKKPWILQSEKPLSRVQFLLVNFPEFHGNP